MSVWSTASVGLDFGKTLVKNKSIESSTARLYKRSRKVIQLKKSAGVGNKSTVSKY